MSFKAGQALWGGFPGSGPVYEVGVSGAKPEPSAVGDMTCPIGLHFPANRPSQGHRDARDRTGWRAGACESVPVRTLRLCFSCQAEIWVTDRPQGSSEAGGRGEVDPQRHLAAFLGVERFYFHCFAAWVTPGKVGDQSSPLFPSGNP